jgi:hypothetical protein
MARGRWATEISTFGCILFARQLPAARRVSRSLARNYSRMPESGLRTSHANFARYNLELKN